MENTKIDIMRVENTHPDFQKMISQLDQELDERYGKLQSEYDKHNLVDPHAKVLIGYIDGDPAACGSFKPFTTDTVEIKRMFITKTFRRKGFSTMLIKELENWERNGVTRPWQRF